MRTTRAVPNAVLLLLLSSVFLSPACSPDTLIILDPILAAAPQDDTPLPGALADTVRAEGRTPQVTVLPSVSAEHLREAVASSPAQLVVAPSLLAGLLVSVAETFPDRRFYLLGSRADVPHPAVQPVPFDRIAAFETAAKVAAGAAEAADGRVVGLFLVDSPQRAREADAFREAAQRELESRGFDANRVSVRQFSATPGAGTLRDAITESMRNGEQQPVVVVALFLGAGNDTAWDLLQERRDASIVTEAPLAVSGESQRLLGWVESRWADALQTALQHAAEGTPEPPVAEARYFFATKSNLSLNLMIDPAED